jgi:hypothetical protein
MLRCCALYIDTKELLLYVCYLCCGGLCVNINTNIVIVLLLLRWLACIYRYKSAVTVCVIRMLLCCACENRL